MMNYYTRAAMRQARHGIVAVMSARVGRARRNFSAAVILWSLRKEAIR